MVSQVKRETLRACLSCPLCDSILRDAATISECLHTFCRRCIDEKITKKEIECCPVCNINLGGAPLDKLRPDHNLQDLRAKIFPLKRRKVDPPELMSLPARRKERSVSSLIFSKPRVSAQARTTGKRTRTVMRKDLRGNGYLAERTMGREPEDIVAFGEECSFKALLVPDHLAQENRVLRHNFSAVSDSLMEANEKLLNLSAERNCAGEVEELKSLLAARDGELEARGKELEAKETMLEAKEMEIEARSLLTRAREDEIRGLRTKIEMLLRERDEAVGKADRLGKELQECKSKGWFEDGTWASEELEHMRRKFTSDMELAVMAARITTRYQVCREWERQGTLGWELEFSKEVYHKYRERVDVDGTSNKYPLLEVYEEEWKKCVAHHRPLESPGTHVGISSLDATGSGTNDLVEAVGQSQPPCCV